MTRTDVEPTAEALDEIDETEGRFLRSEFLVRVAHELRGATGTALGALDELALTSVITDPAIANLVAIARRGSRKVLRTAGRLDRTAELVTHAATMHRSRVDACELLTDAAREAKGTEGRASIELRLDLPSSPCWIDADVGWTTYALSELVAHALRMARARVVAALRHEGPHLCVALTDDRSGPIEATVRRFSNEASRADAGLHLAIIRDVARLHGGDLFVEQLHDEDGRNVGATTSVTLLACAQ